MSQAGPSLIINDEQLLQHISNYQPLYDKTIAGYKSIIQKENCWKAVSKSMNLPVSIIKNRFKSLREKFRREVATERMLTKSGAAAFSRPAWPLMSFFRFMMDGSEPRGRTSTNMQLLSDREDTEFTESAYFTDWANFSDVEIVRESEEECNAISTTPMKRQVANPVKRKHTRSGASGTSLTTEVDQVLKDVSNAVTTIVNKNTKKTKIEHFCSYLVAELEEFESDDANVFMDDITMKLLRYKAKRRHNDAVL